MLVVPPLRSLRNEREGEKEEGSSEFPDFSVGDWLDTIDFDDLLVGIGHGDDLVSDLETELRNFDDFSVADVTPPEAKPDLQNEKVGTATSTVSGVEEPPEKLDIANPSSRRTRKTSRNLAGKKKVKVDWTPELHRRFVQAVEKLGVEKAVPSRILELMGIDCLTRHNVASHLQKYRSRRKHQLGREGHHTRCGGSAAEIVRPSWIMGFPMMMPNFRPPLNLINAWGHPPPSHVWPKPFWIPHHHQVATPCFPPAMPVPGMPALVHHGQGIIAQPHSDPLNPESSVDAAIGDVLSKPWMPLPLGLKPPSVDSVMVELQRQGISNIPPAHCG